MPKEEKKMLSAKEVASKLSIDPKYLRTILRSLPGNNLGGLDVSKDRTRYEWAADDPFLKKLPEIVKKYRDDHEHKKQEAKKKKAAAPAATAASADTKKSTTKTATKKDAKKAAAPAVTATEKGKKKPAKKAKTKTQPEQPPIESHVSESEDLDEFDQALEEADELRDATEDGPELDEGLD